MAYQDHRPDTPAEAVAELLAGNLRFVSGQRIHPHQDAESRAALANAQRPFAVVFGCSDSRMAAEIIFDRGLGDLFVVRTAGHIIGAEVLASIEYGVTVLGAPLVVVLGHDSCGAIAAAYDAMTGATPDPRLRAIIDRVTPSIQHAHDQKITSADDIAVVHVQRTVEMIIHRDTALVDAVAAGRCVVMGMTYRLADGRVTVISSEPPAFAAAAAVGGAGAP
ncbi:MAG: carbonic anhydrase [Micromonosporaceae bacterium]